MTKKDYQLIARALHASCMSDIGDEWTQWKNTVDAIATALAVNPRFDRERFTTECDRGK